MNPNKEQKVSFNRKDAAKYQNYAFKWRQGYSIPDLAKEEGCTNKEMVNRIAIACEVRRFNPEMRRWKKESNSNRWKIDQ